MTSPLELILAIFIVIAAAKHAVLRDASGLFWGLIALLLVALSIVTIPLPYVRLAAALLLSTVALELWQRRR